MHSKIFFDISDFLSIENKFSNLNNLNEKEIQKNKNSNQTSFYFEDYIETNKKIKF